MSAVGFGLLAALLWGISTLVGTRLVRAVGTWSSVVAAMLIGLAIVVPAALVVDAPSTRAGEWLWGVASGVGYVTASICWLLATRTGKVSVVTPIVSTDGAMAAIIVVAAFDETLKPGVGAALGLIAAGIVAAGIRRDVTEHGHVTGRELGFALAAAVTFGFSFVSSAQAEESLGVVWTLVVTRLTAATLLAPAALREGRVRVPARMLPYAFGLAALDIGGYAAFLTGVPGSVAITSVLASQYAMVAVLGGFLLFGERLTRLQASGVAVTLAGVGALAVLRA
jgi:drug/metabolite transporter (DMT)-like permease